MRQSGICFQTTFLILLIFRVILPDFTQAAHSLSPVVQENPYDKQLLLNGRIWRNQYSKTSGDQFFLTTSFMKGSVTLNGQRFNNLDLKYDIASDELLLSYGTYPVIIMNKEMVDSFSISFENSEYHIINAGTDTSDILKGYVNVLYDGPTSLLVKYSKKLQLLAVDNRYDLLIQEHRVYLRKEDEIFPADGKRKLLALLEDKRIEIRNYMKSSRIKISKKNPVTYIPVLKYYDSIRK